MGTWYQIFCYHLDDYNCNQNVDTDVTRISIKWTALYQENVMTDLTRGLLHQYPILILVKVK